MPSTREDRGREGELKNHKTHNLPSASIEHGIRKCIRLKEQELATLDERTSERRETIECEVAKVKRELATLDEQAQRERERLEEQIRILRQAAEIEADSCSPKGVTSLGSFWNGLSTLIWDVCGKVLNTKSHPRRSGGRCDNLSVLLWVSLSRLTAARNQNSGLRA